MDFFSLRIRFCNKNFCFLTWEGCSVKYCLVLHRHLQFQNIDFKIITICQYTPSIQYEKQPLECGSCVSVFLWFGLHQTRLLIRGYSYRPRPCFHMCRERRWLGRFCLHLEVPPAVFLLAWLHSSCSMSRRQVELRRKIITKPFIIANAALCIMFSLKLQFTKTICCNVITATSCSKNVRNGDMVWMRPSV